MKELEFEDIQKMYDAAKNYNSERRQDAQNELYFYWISHYSDAWRDSLPLRFQGQFDQLRKAGRKIMADLNANQVRADFQPIDGTEEDMGDFLDRLYRTDSRRNDSREAFSNAVNECVPCGVGGWRLVTEYETDRIGEKKQVIRRVPIYEFNASVFFDPSAKRIDKSDARWCQVLTAYSKDDYDDLKDEMDVDDDRCLEAGFTPITSEQGIWCGEQDEVFVIEHYQRYMKKQTIHFYRDMFGEETAFYDEQVKDIKDELEAAGYLFISKKTIKRWCVTKYTTSGEGILEDQEIAGTEIPIVPYYGERAFVDGVEHYEGITRLAQDPQRLRNFQMSYLADIVSTSPRPKPIFYPEQVLGHEHMYEENGADNNYPYYLMNPTTVNGVPLPPGPIGMMPETPIPAALITSIQMMGEATADVAQSGAPNSIADVNLSGNAISQISAMLDEQSVTYQEHFKYAIRRDAEIYAGMVPDVYDVPRKVTLTSQDGSREEAYVMQSTIDLETGEMKVLNDMRTAKFEVFAEIGMAYESQKQQQRQELTQLLQSVDPTNPVYDGLLMKYIALSDGVDNDDLKEYAKKRLILTGFKEPETDEEKEMFAQAQEQSNQPDPNMALAMAEQAKADADMQKVQVDMYNAETSRMKVQLEASKLGIDLEIKQADLTGKQIDNMQKLRIPKVPQMGQRMAAQ
jgi:hypothetical protein